MPQHLRSYSKSVCLSILFVISAATVFSQTTTSTNPQDTTTAKVIQPIPVVEIGTEREKTLNLIKEIRSSAKPSKSEIELDSIIPLRLEEIEQQKKILTPEDVVSMNYKQVEGLKPDIIKSKTKLEDWRSVLTNKIEEINKLKSTLSENKRRWTITLELERDEKLIRQVTDRIRTNLKEIDQLSKELITRTDNLLTVQTELTDGILYMEEILNAISQNEEEYKSNLFTTDSPPIWKLLSVAPPDTLETSKNLTQNLQDTLTTSQQIKGIINSHNQEFEDFVETYQLNVYYHLLVFAILLFFTFYLKGDVNKWSDEKKDTAISQSLHVISKPFWSSLLVALMLTGLFYPNAPESVSDLFFLGMIFPILIILPGLIPSINKRYFYFVGGIFVVTQVQDYFNDLIILDRFLEFFVQLLTLVVLLILQKSKKSIQQADNTIRWGFAFLIMRLTIFLLSIALITNIIGNMVLSRLLTNGCLPMIYGGVILFATAVILKSIFALLLQHDSLGKLNMIKNYPDEVKKNIFRIIRWLIVLYWLFITLSGFEIFEPIYSWFEGLLTREWIVGSVSLSIGSILAFFITLWVSLTLSKFIRFILQDEILTHFEMPRGVPGAISMIVRLVLIVLGFVLAFGAAKIDMSNITIIFGALGVGIGFGLQNIFNNLVSGLILAFERPIQVGDTIQISTLNLMGDVSEIGIRASIVRTFDGAEVIVPNGNLISNEMINWTLSDHRRRQEIIVGVAYGTDTTKVLEILNAVVPEQENVLKNPSPLIIFIGFGASSLDFRVLFWTHFNNGLGTKSRVGIAIDEAFKKAGINIPFPQRDLHLRSVDKSIDLLHEKKPVSSRRKTATVKSPKTKSDKK